MLSTYPLLTRDHEVLLQQQWHAVILDEAQSIKNPNAETTRQALRLKARQRLCLSGTPLQNHLGELWSLFDFLAPGFLGNQRMFKSQYRTPIEKHGDVERQDLLNRRIRPFMLRRTKQEVITELPPKTEIVESIEMEANQRAIYEAIRLSMHAKVQAAIASKGLARSGIIILDALLKMRQACCDPRLLKLKTVSKAKAGSAKLDRLMEMLSIMFAEGRRVLLFLPVHRDAGLDRDQAAGGWGRFCPADRGHQGPRDPGAEIPERRRAAVPDQPEGRRRRAEPDGGRYRRALRSMVGTPRSRIRPPTAPTASARPGKSSSTGWSRWALSRRRWRC